MSADPSLIRTEDGDDGVQFGTEERSVLRMGRAKGAEHRPEPGDVLSVRTAIGPESGHVVTVVWAETDGCHSGTMWYVSGNAAHRSVSCDFVQVVDTPKRPPRGAVAIINRVKNGGLQPDRLGAKRPQPADQFRPTRPVVAHRPDLACRHGHIQPRLRHVNADKHPVLCHLATLPCQCGIKLPCNCSGLEDHSLTQAPSRSLDQGAYGFKAAAGAYIGGLRLERVMVPLAVD